MASTNVQRELQLAMEDGRPLLPLVLDQHEQPPEVRYILAGRQSIELLDRPESQWLPQVLQGLDRLGIAAAGGAAGLYAPESATAEVERAPAKAHARLSRLGGRPVIVVATLAAAVIVLLFLGARVMLRSNAAKAGTIAKANGAGRQVSLAAASHSAPLAVSIYAGTGQAGHVNGPAALAQFSAPQGLDILPDGTLLIGDNGNARIRQVTAGGSVSDFCGSGVAGYADGPCSSAQFSLTLQGATRGPDGTIYVAENNNLRIRAISATGIVSTLAGSGVKGFADGEGTAAQFGSVARLAVDARSGALYTSDYVNSRIRKITPSGGVATFAGSGTPGYVDGPGAVAQFNQPHNLAVDAKGNVYVGDVGNHRIRKITPDGAVSTLAGSATVGLADGVGAQAQFGGGTLAIAIDAISGNLYVMDGGNRRIRRVTPDGAVSTVFEFVEPDETPFFISLAPSGDFYLTDSMHNRIYKVTGAEGR